ncbi:MAG: ATP-binding protein [Lachnospiraceae bacterium]
MSNQKDQLLMVSELLTNNIEISMMEYQDNLEFLSSIENSGKVDDEFYRQYLEMQDSFICNILWEDTEGKLTKSIYALKPLESLLVTKLNSKMSIWQENDGDRRYMVFKNRLDNGGILGLAIDVEQYYIKLISNIRIGTNGYVVIKNSSGQIIMHPDTGQWGIDVIEGRKKRYPGLDFFSLEAMIEEQKDGIIGISEYYSYWWTHPQVARVKKVAAYAPATTGDDFWIISAVTDYDDLYIPIKEGFVKIILVFLGILCIFLALSFYILKLLQDRRKASREIVYLKELNELLEEVQRGEEVIAHQQRLQVMGTMTSGIAHEFNNFLTPILGYAELLMMELPDESETYESALEIYEAAEKAKDIVRQISLLSRKNVETVYKSISAEKMIMRALKLVKSVCPPQITLSSDIRLGPAAILGNTTQINQMLLNICMNAIHAIGKNSGAIVIRGRCINKKNLEHKIEIKVSDAWQQYIQIDIEDDGVGMDSDTLRQIFDPFFTTKKGGEGTGLGLALAEQIVHSHKGYIYAESQSGKGSIFHIFFPVLERNLGTEPVVWGQKKNLRLVIVDDNAKVLQLLKKNFARIKLDIATCRSKDDLQLILNEQEVDVLVIDQNLDGASSIDLCMAMKERYPDMIFIVMVDYISREIVEAKNRKIIDDYIGKPVSDTTILEAVRSCMENY